jgi:hypothetical protein
LYFGSVVFMVIATVTESCQCLCVFRAPLHRDTRAMGKKNGGIGK